MDLSSDLISKFVKITHDSSNKKSSESTVYGTTVEYNDRMYVKIDGSDLLTPVETTADIQAGERVTIMIKNHSATVTGNITSPSASSTVVTELGNDVDEIGNQITEFEIVIADKVDTKQLVAERAQIEELIASKASIEELEAIDAKIENLEVGNLDAINAEIDNLKANKADIKDLNATNADIEILDAEVADIKTLVNGNLTSDNIQSLHLTAGNTTIDNALIKDAMIDSISANKINSGAINTNNVSIQSEDGSMILQGNVQQFKDENDVVRIQIGKDATGNFTFALFSQDGVGILIDETGIKAGAVPDGLIVNDMVADNANISGGKLDISSVISSINNNVNTLSSSKIKFDDTEQTLDVAFNQLKNKVETIENITIDGDLSSVIEQITTNTTNISIIQGQISSLISNTTIIKEDGTVTQLKDEFNSVQDTVNSHTQTINSLETNYKDNFAYSIVLSQEVITVICDSSGNPI